MERWSLPSRYRLLDALSDVLPKHHVHFERQGHGNMRSLRHQRDSVSSYDA